MSLNRHLSGASLEPYKGRRVKKHRPLRVEASILRLTHFPRASESSSALNTVAKSGGHHNTSYTSDFESVFIVPFQIGPPAAMQLLANAIDRSETAIESLCTNAWEISTIKHSNLLSLAKEEMAIFKRSRLAVGALENDVRARGS